MSDVTCPYCGGEAEYISNAAIYGRPLGTCHMIYRCAPCDAHVGTHHASGLPLGPLADKATRTARMAAHAAFDPLWKSGRFGRKDAYHRLARRLKRVEIHIGWSNVEECQRIVEACEAIKRDIRFHEWKRAAI